MYMYMIEGTQVSPCDGIVQHEMRDFPEGALTARYMENPKLPCWNKGLVFHRDQVAMLQL